MAPSAHLIHYIEELPLSSVRVQPTSRHREPNSGTGRNETGRRGTRGRGAGPGEIASWAPFRKRIFAHLLWPAMKNTLYFKHALIIQCHGIKKNIVCKYDPDYARLSEMKRLDLCYALGKGVKDVIATWLESSSCWGPDCSILLQYVSLILVSSINEMSKAKGNTIRERW